jgi:hypothetical protein
MTINADDILAVTKNVTKEWTKQRKAEERNSRARYSRQYIYSDRVNFTDVADDILPPGYAHASGDGRYTVDKRQFYYCVRDEFLEETGQEITADYFSQNLLVKYMNQHPQKTAAWKITASPRGTLTIPNTDSGTTRIPCGTTAIEEHLAAEAARPCSAFDDIGNAFRVQWPSLAEGQRYQAVLYIEKEGFDPQLREARIAERFDLAIISCKGQSVVAARKFVDHVCRVGGGVPLFILHDMDKSGFEISQRLTTVSDHAIAHDLVKYQFQNKINVTDLGLRLTDVEKYNLSSEHCTFRGRFPPDTITTREERDFLRSNRRVELNAFTAPQFIEYVESSLRKYLPERLLPEEAVLTDAYRRALVLAHINRAIQETRDKAIESAREAKIPPLLRDQIRYVMKKDDLPWDQALYKLAESMLSQQAND